MQQPFTIRVSDQIERLMTAPEPVVALNLMGLDLLGSPGFVADRAVFWVDGIMGSLACRLRGLSVERRPGRDLLREALVFARDKAPDRPVVVMGFDGDLRIVQELLGRDVAKFDLPWVKTLNDVNAIELPPLGPTHLIFLAVGSPKQEWIADLIYQSTGAKCFCVGGAVNMLEGREKTVPDIFAKLGLEWLFRLMTEPKRRFARLFSTLPKGIANLTKLGGLERLS